MVKKKGVQENIHSAQEGDLGRLLIGLRESAGHSLSQTAEAMCLSEEILAQLENEDFESLPEPPYIRGYLRNYAKLAENEADELIACYESLRGADPSDLNYHFKSSAKIHSQHKKNVSPVIMQLIFLAILFGVLVGLSMIPGVNQWIKTTWNSFSNQTNTQSIDDTDNPLLTGTMPVPTPLPTEVLPVENINNNPVENTNNNQPSTTLNINKKPKPSSENNTNDTEKVITDVTDKKESDNKVVDTPPAESIKVGEENKNEALIPASTDGSINIKLVFNKEVWMRIRDGKKKTVFEGQNSSGQEKELQLKKPLTFRVGNAQGLSLFVDGKVVDISSYIKGSVANFTLE
jgi:cytoskeletal protein RodZ